MIDRKIENIGERVRQLTADGGVDIIIDPVAGPTIAENIRVLAPCGMLVRYGALRPFHRRLRAQLYALSDDML